MLIGYMRVSKIDGSQTTDLQHDGLLAAGVSPTHLYEDYASGKIEDRPGLMNCLKALREGDTLVVWKLDRLGRDLHYLINMVHDLTGHGTAIDTTTAAGKLVFGIFAALAEFEREQISERTRAGLASAKGGRPFKMTTTKLRLAMAAMENQRPGLVICAKSWVSRDRHYTDIFRLQESCGLMERNYSISPELSLWVASAPHF